MHDVENYRTACQCKGNGLFLSHSKFTKVLSGHERHKTCMQLAFAVSLNSDRPTLNVLIHHFFGQDSTALPAQEANNSGNGWSLSGR